MPLRTPRSLHLRLWGVIGMACLPVFLMAFFDYRERRQDAIVALENEVSRMLTAARLTEDAALGSMRQTFQIMARADNLQSLDPQDCSGLAQRLLQSMEDFANLGAALPDGTVFCSASPGPTRVSVTDRNWFQEAQSGEGITSGEFVTGRISGKPGMVFGYPVRDADGTLKAVLFASIQLDWFDKLIAEFKLPQGWNAFLLSDTGTVLSYHPAASRPPQTAQAPAGAAPFLRALQEGRRISEIEGLDGNRRMYGVGSPRFSRTPLLVAIGAPLDRTVARIDQGFWWRILLLAGIALVSVLTARFYIYGLIEAWTGQITAAIDSVAAGRLQTRIRRLSHVSELRAVEQGINHMASELEKREVDLRRLSTAVEQSPEAIVITDTLANIQYVNDAFLRSTGYTREEVLGRNPRILNRGLTPPATYTAMWDALKAGKVWSGELINTRKDGSSYVEMATIAPIFDEEGQVTHYVSTKVDITQRKQSEALVHQLAYYDALTGLPNRTLLHEHLQQAVEASAQGTAQGMLLLIDIDRFKQINDTGGMPRATGCCARWRGASGAAPARPTPWHAWAATPLASSCPTWAALPTWHRPSPARCTRRSPPPTTWKTPSASTPPRAWASPSSALACPHPTLCSNRPRWRSTAPRTRVATPCCSSMHPCRPPWMPAPHWRWRCATPSRSRRSGSTTKYRWTCMAPWWAPRH